MSWTLPPETRYSFKKGSEGIVVWAIQKALSDTHKGPGLVLDGHYGTRTKNRVMAFQVAKALIVDGIFGPASSASMAVTLQSKVTVALPHDLLRGVVEGESDNYIGAVNWSVPGGVDCGYCQRRVLNGSDDAAIQRAFDGFYQMTLLGNALRNRHDIYLGKPGAQNHERAWRLATLFHNYPAGADKIASVGESGLSPYWTTDQQWVLDIGKPGGIYFPDGERIRTPLEWCEHYALGAGGHNEPGKMTRFVTDWTP